MLSTFPELFTYSLFAPFLLRLALGGFFIFQGMRRHKQDSEGWNTLWNNAKIGSLSIAPLLTKIQIILGVLIVVGLYTQISVILAALFVGAEVYRRHRITPLTVSEVWPSVFLIVVSISLLFLGAGVLAFDLPL